LEHRKDQIVVCQTNGQISGDALMLGPNNVRIPGRADYAAYKQMAPVSRATNASPPLVYSSARPWILALAMSLTLWGFAAWSVWILVQ
jgi:hypothetical protein